MLAFETTTDTGDAHIVIMSKKKVSARWGGGVGSGDGEGGEYIL